jgi:hypothetical protein
MPRGSMGLALPGSWTGKLLLESLSVPKINSRSRAAVVIKPVSANSLRKTGIFAGRAGNFRRFSPQVRRIGSPETKANARKAGISGPFSRLSGSQAERTDGWLATQYRSHPSPSKFPANNQFFREQAILVSRRRRIWRKSSAFAAPFVPIP